MFDSTDIYFYFLKSNFHTLAYNNLKKKKIELEAYYIHFFKYNVDIETRVNRNSTTSTFLFV